MLDWIQDNEALFYSIGTLTVVSLLVLPILMTVVLVRLPVTYFANEHRSPAQPPTRPRSLLRLLGLAGKNLLGAVFLAAGFAMLVLPGQGILTMLLGLSLMNFPGKYRLERWLIRHGATLRVVNALRHRFGAPPLVLQQADH